VAVKTFPIFVNYPLKVGVLEGEHSDQRTLDFVGEITRAWVSISVTPSQHMGAGFRLEINGNKVWETTWAPFDLRTRTYREEVTSLVGKGGAINFLINGFKTAPYPGEITFNVTVLITIEYTHGAVITRPTIKWPEIPWWAIAIIILAMVAIIAYTLVRLVAEARVGAIRALASLE